MDERLCFSAHLNFPAILAVLDSLFIALPVLGRLNLVN